MKMILSFLLIFLLASCKTHIDTSDININKYDTSYSFEDPSIHIAQFEEPDTSKFYKLINTILDKKGIIFSDSTSFSKSELTIRWADGKYKIDSFKNKNDIIVARDYSQMDSVEELEIEHLKFRLDTLEIVRDDPESQEKHILVPLEFDSRRIRKFSFNNQAYYYLQMVRPGDVISHVIYDVSGKSLHAFQTQWEPGYYYVGDVNGDKNLDFLFINNGVYNESLYNHFTITICSLKNGEFQILKDKSDKKYFIEGVILPKNNEWQWICDVGKKFYITNYNWPVKVDLKQFLKP